MKRRIIEAVEGQTITGLSATDLVDLQQARTRLKDRLRPTLPLFEDTSQGVVPRNIVGTVGINSRTVLSITPKVGEQDDWVGASLDLMVPERASLAGHRRASHTNAQRSLESGLAVIYRDRLERALRAEGPIEVMHSEFARSGSLDGQLDIEEWLIARPRRDFSFPVHRSVLDANNELTAALSLAAVILARSVSDGGVRSALMKLAGDVRPGLPEVAAFDPSVIGRPLPQQWARYDEAWSIAQVVLRTAGFTSHHGSLSGVEVAVEPWVLLEELLDRAVSEVVRHARELGLDWHNRRHPAIDFLYPDQPGQGALSRLLTPRGARPENLIVSPNGPIASFEAKYSRPAGPAAIRHHMYQLLTTAAYAESPCAVLVYPELAEPIHWRATSMRTSVRDVYAVGLNLYGYTKNQGVAGRASQLLQIIQIPGE
jgi:McrBC 5-methylcytosine restriction system component